MKELLWNKMIQYGTRVKMPKDVFLSGNCDNHISNYVYLLEEGICALTSITRQGEEKVYLYFHPHRLIGFNQFMVSQKKQREGSPSFSVVTKTSCILYQIPALTFRDLTAKDPEFNAFLLETLADNYDDALVHFHLMQEESAVVRLCSLLLEVAQPFKGLLLVPKFFTYGEMAKYLGCHPVTVSRIMAKLKQLGYIAKTREGIVMENRERLEKLVHSESCIKY